MEGQGILPVCSECKGRKFENIDGRLVCEECQTVVPVSIMARIMCLMKYNYMIFITG